MGNFNLTSGLITDPIGLAGIYYIQLKNVVAIGCCKAFTARQGICYCAGSTIGVTPNRKMVEFAIFITGQKCYDIWLDNTPVLAKQGEISEVDVAILVEVSRRDFSP